MAPAVFLFDKDEVHTLPVLIETHNEGNLGQPKKFRNRLPLGGLDGGCLDASVAPLARLLGATGCSLLAHG